MKKINFVMPLLKKGITIVFFSLFFCFSMYSQNKPITPYTPDWESLDKHKMPEWYDDAKLGLSLHWGVYSVPAWAPRNNKVPYAEWYGQRMHEDGNETVIYHRNTYGENFHYDDFIPDFKAENYNPDEWMKFVKAMGGKYIFITSKHHDGFCLWPSKYTDRNSVKMGPHKDILKMYFEAARKHGLKVGLYYSIMEWHNPAQARDSLLYIKAKKTETPYTGYKPVANYINDFMIPQVKELIDLYHPDFFFFDGEWDKPEKYWRMKEVVAYYYNEAAKRNQEVFVNDRYGMGLRGKHGDLYNVEYHYDNENIGRLDHKWSYWQGIAKTFGYNRDCDPADCWSPKQFIHKFIEAVSTNGNFDINCGPTSAGIIPEYEQYPLLKLGEWLKVNGEAIYGTRFRKDIQREGDASFTTKGDYVYAIFNNWQDDKFNLKSVKPVQGSVIELLGVPGKLEWKYDETNGLTIFYPWYKSRPTECAYAWSFKIKIQ